MTMTKKEQEELTGIAVGVGVIKAHMEHVATKDDVHDALRTHEDRHHPVKQKTSITPRPSMSPREKAAWGLLTAVAMSGGFWMWLA